MRLCTDWSLVKSLPGEIDLKILECRSWGCERCGPKRKKRLISEVIHGEPNRLLTLTVNPAVGEDADERRAMLANAWKCAVKRLRRWKPEATFEFFSVVERTQAGEPHLHIAMRAPYIPHGLISAWMGELIGAPVVDIRAITSATKAAYYVAKYVSKAPERFSTFKRYWHSQNWEVDPDPEYAKPAPGAPRWKVDRRPRWEIDRELQGVGWYPSLFSLLMTKYFPGINAASVEYQPGGP